MNKKLKYTLIAVVCFLIVILPVSFSLIQKDDSLSIIDNLTYEILNKEEVLTIQGINPMDDETGMKQGAKLLFNLSGSVDTESYIKLNIINAESLDGYTRFNKDSIKYVLKENINGVSNIVYGPSTLSDNTIYTKIIRENNDIDYNYELVMWVSSSSVVVSDTIKFANGKTVLSTEDYNNSYQNIKISLTGNYTSTLVDNEFKSVDGSTIKGKLTDTGKEINITKAYNDVNYANSDVEVEFVSPSMYKQIYFLNLDTNESEILDLEKQVTCTYLNKVFDKSGSYLYYGIDDDKKSDAGLINIKIDKIDPTFKMETGSKNEVSDYGAKYEVVNKLTEINDDNSYKLYYQFVKHDTDPVESNYKELSDTTIRDNLSSGNYDLVVKMKSDNGKEFIRRTNYEIYYSLPLIDESNKHENLSIKVVVGMPFNYMEEIPVIDDYYFKGFSRDKEVTYDLTKNNVPSDLKELYFLYATEYFKLDKLDNKACNTLTYNGKEQVLVNDSISYQIYNSKQINAGTYEVEIKLNDNYIWSDDTKDSIKLNCTINKADLTIETKSDYKLYDGTELLNNNYDITSGSLMNNDKLELVIDTKISDIGKVKNKVDSYSIKNGYIDVTDNYNVTIKEGYLEILSRQINKPSSKLCNSLTYNGTEQELLSSEYSGYTFDITKGTNAGSYKLKAHLNDNYEWEDGTTSDIDITCKIDKISITIAAESDSKIYDGTPLTNMAGNIVKGNLIDGHTLVGKSNSTITNYGKITNHLDEVTIVDSNNIDVSQNYNISLLDGELEIKKRDLLITPNSDQTKNYGDKDSVITYKYSNNIDGDDISFSGSLTRNSGENIGDYEIINNDLKCNNKNYNIVVAKNINYSIKEKPIGELDIKILNNKYTYDGKEKKAIIEVYNGKNKVDSSNYVVTYSNNVNAGTAKVFVSGKGNYTGVFESSFEIEKRELVVTVDSNLSKEYKSNDPDLTYKVSNSIEGEEPVLSGKLERTTGENIGKYEINIGTLALSSNDTFNKDNYTLKFVSNIFEITKKDFGSVDIILEYESVVYNGSENKPGINIKDNDEVLDTSCYELSYSNNINAGTATITLKGINNYEGTIKKTFEITKRPIKVTIGSKSKTYDGTKLVDHTYTYNETDLVNNDTLRVMFNTSITDVGKIENTPSVVQVINNKVKVTDNYNIELVSGTLEVTKAEMKFDVTNCKSEYDGKNHSIKLDYSKDYNVTIYYSNSSIDETNYSNLNKGLNYKNVGTYTVYFYAHDNTGNYKDYYSGDYNNNGKIEITKKELSIEASVKSKVYDGNNKATCVIKLNGIVNNDNVSVTYDGTYEKTIVGTNIVTCTNIKLDDESSKNYTLKEDTVRVNGDITKKDIKPVVSINTKNYDGDLTAYGDFKLEGVLDTDDVLLDGKCNYIDKNAGNDKKVNCTDFKLSGNSKDNYYLDTNTYSTKGSINQKSISVASFEYLNTDKEYDGNNLNTKLVINAKNLNNNDKINVSYSKASYNDSNVDKASNLTITGITIDNGNYKLDKQDYTVKAYITKTTFIPKVYITDFIYGNYKEPSIVNNLSNGDVTYYYNKTDSNKDGTIYNSNTKLDSGTYYLYAVIKSTTNYDSVTSSTVKFNVNKQNNSIEVQNYDTLVESRVDLSKLVSNNKGELTFEITKQTTNDSYIKDNYLYVGTNSDKDDNKKEVIIKVIDKESNNYLSSSNIFTVYVDKYEQTLNFDSNNVTSINYNDNTHKINVVSETNGEKGNIIFESTNSNILTFDENNNIITKNSGTCKVKVTALSTNLSKKAISYINITVNNINGNIKLNKNSDSIKYLEDSYVIKIDSSTSLEFDIETKDNISYRIENNNIYLNGLSKIDAGTTLNIKVIGKSNSKYNEVSSNFVLNIDKTESVCEIVNISTVNYPSNNKGYIEYKCNGDGSVTIKNNKYINVTNIKDNKIYFIANNIGTDNIKLVLNDGKNYLGYEIDSSIEIKPSTYTITYNDEISSSETKEVTYGERYGTLYKPSSNRKFIGWYLDREYKVEVKESSIVKLNRDTILYAKYSDSIAIERTTVKRNIFQRFLDLFK